VQKQSFTKPYSGYNSLLRYFFLSFQQPYKQVKLPNNSKPGIELTLLDLFSFKLLVFEVLSLMEFESLMVEPRDSVLVKPGDFHYTIE
jgi:hypothetical protein